MSKRVAIVQSNYVPWRGYFDLVDSVDEFVLLDDAQYTRRDWRNRNKVKTPRGPQWLTVSVEVKGRYDQAIQDTRVADPAWAAAHWRFVRETYAGAAGFDEMRGFLEQLYATVPGPMLSDVNHHFLSAICERLGIATALTWSRDYEPQGTKTDRLLDICRKASATEYVSGPAAKPYLEVERFAAEGIDVAWHEYGPYAEYEQIHPPFEPHVSILDVLLCAGDRAGDLIRPVAVEGRP
ncbi:MAG: WbqC family protein [Solirubrobacteraceae bacterium]